MSPAPLPLWLGRYRGPTSLRDGRHFDVLSAVRASDRAGCVIVRPGSDARPTLVGRCLRDLADAHASIDHPRVPALAHVELAGDTPFVELACEVAIDATELVRALSEHRARLPYAQLVVLRDAWLDGMEAAHRAGQALGRLSLADLWLSVDGQPWVVGWGTHVTLARDDGSIDASLAALVAPEVAAGLPPTPESDLAVALRFVHAMAPVTELPPALARDLSGTSLPADSAALEASRALDRAFLAESPGARPSFAEGRAMLRTLDAAIGIEPDPAGLTRTVEGVLVRSAEHEVPWLASVEPTEKVVTVHEAGQWVDSDAGRTTLGPSLRAILAHLLEQRATHPGRTSTLWDLLEVGWPEERLRPDAGANRVYAAIKRLRKLGLLGALEWHEGGYRIAPSAPLTTIG